MDKYITEITAVDPVDGNIKRWMGPYIEAESFDAAQQYCVDNGLGYCLVTGRYVDEIPWESALFASRVLSDSIKN